MGELFAETQASSHGNTSTLTKIDKLRERIGNRVALPQVTVVGDQSSGKSSVLEGITGFAFPRSAELCTRYCTQITCRRDGQRTLSVSIIPHDDAEPAEKDRLRAFSEKVDDLDNKHLAEIFTKANDAMGLRSNEHPDRPAFSESMLKIEISGPDQEHFTVIDVPGIFRRETKGLTTENDIGLVRKMVKNSMKDNRTIILAIIPSNVDPATQEILKLAKEVDPEMSRTMGVLTKPDLNIERATQQIALDHVTGKRHDLTLGYHIVKNRGPDDLSVTLRKGQEAEQQFFSAEPWSALRRTGRTGIFALKKRVQELLHDIIKKEFPKLKLEVTRELSDLRAQRDDMGISRSSPQAQRLYLSAICEKYQALKREALDWNYNGSPAFFEDQQNRIITEIAALSSTFSRRIPSNALTSTSARDEGRKQSHATVLRDTESRLPGLDQVRPDVASDLHPEKGPETKDMGYIGCLFDTALDLNSEEYPELETILEYTVHSDNQEKDDVSRYIEDLYEQSRGFDLVSFPSSILATIFQEQTQCWEPITLRYVSGVIRGLHGFFLRALQEACPDERVREELYSSHLLDELLKAYNRAMNSVKFLLKMARESRIYTLLLPEFHTLLQKAQNAHAVTDEGDKATKTKGLGHINIAACTEYVNGSASVKADDSEHIRNLIQDTVESYYKVARDRFIDNVFQQAVDYHLLTSENGPLHVFSYSLVTSLKDEALEMIAGEDSHDTARRARLDRDIGDFQQALMILKGTK